MVYYTILLRKRSEFVKRLPQVKNFGRSRGLCNRESERLLVRSVLGIDTGQPSQQNRQHFSLHAPRTITSHPSFVNISHLSNKHLHTDSQHTSQLNLCHDLLGMRTGNQNIKNISYKNNYFNNMSLRRFHRKPLFLGNNWVATSDYLSDTGAGIFTRHLHVKRDINGNLSNTPEDFNSRMLSTSPALQEPSKLKTDEEKSKIEETVEALRKKREDEELFIYHPPQVASKPSLPPVKKTMVEKVKEGVMHYVHGFKLLFLEIQISTKLLWRVLNGHSLTRRERKIFLRTVADLFKMIPLLVFLVVPFMEFALPIVIKLFPNMLPSTFEDKTKKEETTLKRLRLKIQMAKFMQDTVEEMAVQARKKKSQDSVVEFANFFEKIRSKGLPPDNEEILKFCKLFEDEITLDNMGYPMLKALSNLLNLQTVGTDNYLRFQLRMKLRQLRADDMMIKKEGIDSLDVQELQAAVIARGMRAIGVPEVRLKTQLKQWLELHLDEEVPASLLLMSRALFMPETVVPVAQLKATLSELPETMVDEAEIKLAETSGEEVDVQTKIDVLKRERELMDQERQQEESEALEIKKKAEAAVQASAEAEKTEILEDKAPVIKDVDEYSTKQLLSIQEALPVDMDREELEQIKEDREEFNEELKDLKEVDEDKEFKESVASKRLGKRVDKMIDRLERSLKSLEQELDKLPKDTIIDADRDGIITTKELSEAIKKLESFPNAEKCKRISELLDEDKDGNVDMDSMHKIIAVLAKEDVKLTSNQIEEIILLVQREELLQRDEMMKENILKAEREASEREIIEKELQENHKNNSSSENKENK